MILYKRTWNEYLIFVHASADANAEPFATIWLRGNFLHRDLWNEIENSLACLAIAELKRHESLPEIAHNALCDGWTEIARENSEDGN